MNAIKNVKRFLDKFKLTPISENLQPFEKQLKETLTVYETLKNFSDEQLKEIALNLKGKILKGDLIDAHLVDMYALVMQACKRKLNLIPYPVQVQGAIALQQRNIIEMQTGEGKTLVAVFAASLNALSGKGVHVLTFNDYLAKRDANWMRPVYAFLGLTVGYIQEQMDARSKQKAYGCDVTYATAKEIGFDYLRSCMAYDPTEILLRDFNYAIVDEADAILIDEARNPLVFAGKIDDRPIDLHAIAQYVSRLVATIDYRKDEHARNVYLTDSGIAKTEYFFSILNLYDDSHRDLLIAVNLALQAKALLHKDIDYIVDRDRVKLVDEFTGRIMEDRKWQNGLQAAVEAKEGLPVLAEGRILNSISLQHLMGCYPKVSGMTGTARHAADEFANFYGLGVTVIPPHKPCRRTDQHDRIFTHKASKLKSILEEVKKIHSTGRPILIGTLTVKESEELQVEMERHGLACTVLNARNNESEAMIIENAGSYGAITISTNMAGRGTDILLGGKDQVDKETIVALGGLHIIGTNRHESIRIDDQLKGRAGRQGDPGSSQFIISMEDDLMIRYGLKALLPKNLQDLRQEGPINSVILRNSIAHAQRIIEGQLYEIRLSLHQYAYFIERQRTILLQQRQRILFSEEEKNNEYMLYQYDVLWSQYLSDIAGLRESIHWHRMAGKNPLQEFYKAADEMFQQLMLALESKLSSLDSLTEEEIKIKRPSSTWTYLVNDNPFKSPTAFLLSNVGYQVNLLTGPVLILMKMIEKMRRKKVEKNDVE
jgi:preprotein translocase subunit SecA